MHRHFQILIGFWLLALSCWLCSCRTDEIVYPTIGTHVTDKIIAYPKGQQFRWTMLNLGTVKINGVDAKVDMSFFLPLRFVLRTRRKTRSRSRS